MNNLATLALLTLLVASAPTQAMEPHQIREAQSLLNALGYRAGTVDGLTGPSTRRAVGAFRHSRGMAADGGIDQALILALREQAAERELPLSRDDVRTAQTLLREAGLAVGTPDGIVGAKTRAAAAEYRRARGLEPRGQIDRALLTLLLQGDGPPESLPDKATRSLPGKATGHSRPVSRGVDAHPTRSDIRSATTAPPRPVPAGPVPSADQIVAIDDSSRGNDTSGAITRRLDSAIESTADQIVSLIGTPNSRRAVHIKLFVHADTNAPAPRLSAAIHEALGKQMTAYGQNAGVVLTDTETEADFVVVGGFNGTHLEEGFKLVSVLLARGESPVWDTAYWVQEASRGCLLLDEEELEARIFDPAHIAYSNDLRDSAQRKLTAEWNAADLGYLINAAIDDSARKVIAESKTIERLAWPYSADTSAAVAGKIIDSALRDPTVVKALADVGKAVQESTVKRMRGQLESYFRDYIACINEVLAEQDRLYISDAYVLDLEQQTVLTALAGATRTLETQLDARRVAMLAAIGATVARGVTRKVAGRVASKLGSRVGGKLFSRFIPGVGLLLMGAEYLDAENGSYVFELANEVRGTEEIRRNVLNDVTNDVTGAFEDKLTETREVIYAGYEQFKIDYREVLQMRRKYDDFSDFLAREATGPKFRRLKQLRDLVPDEEVLVAMRSGTLAEVIALPDGLFEHLATIVADTRDIGLAHGWMKVSRDRLPLVARARLYGTLPLDGITANLLERLLRLDDVAAISTLGGLPKRHHGALEQMTDAQWRLLLDAAKAPEQLSKSLTLIGLLDRAGTDLLLRGASHDPGAVERLFAERDTLARMGPDDQIEILDLALHGTFSERLQALLRGPQRGLKLRMLWAHYWWGLLLLAVLPIGAWLGFARSKHREAGIHVQTQ